MLASEYVARGWCQGADARDKDEYSISVRDPSAVKWCLVGAIYASNEPPYGGRLANILEICRKLTGGLRPTIWNDKPERTQAQVVELLQEAEALTLGG